VSFDRHRWSVVTWRRVRRYRIGSALAAGLVLASATVAEVEAAVDTGARSALIVSNAAYGFNPLDNPINDGRALAGTLRELGFEVTLLENVGRAEFEAALTDLSFTFQAGGIGLFYYAGHAVQYQGINYLLPTDFELEQGADLRRYSVSIDSILQSMDEAGVGLKLVVLDSCRNYPFGEVNEAFGQGLASVATTGETLVAYATAAGQFALDGQGPNSPYTSALISALELPGHDVYDIFRIVRAKVREATDGKQLPWVSGSIETQIVFRDAEPEVAAPAPGELTVASVHWNTIKASADPADFSEFLQLYPQSDYGPAAVERIQLLTRQGEQSPGPVLANVETLAGPGAQVLEVTPCDLWAADPFDPQRVTAGIEWGLVNTRQALRACASAVAEQPDDPRLNFQLGRALDVAERFEEAMSFYQRAADAGYPAALKNIGFMYRTARGVPRDFERAAEYYFMSALDGVPAARSAVAKLYEEGWGLPQSYDDAFRWYQLAAEQGFAPAIDAVGVMYHNGWGVEANLAKAAEYHRKAAALGWGNALSNMGKLYAKGEGVPQDVDEAVRWFAEATEQGHAYAPYHWAGLLREGNGVAKDPRRALALYELSADRGFEWALWKIADMHETGDLGAPDLEKAYYYYWIARAAGEMRRNSGSDQLAEASNDRLARLRAQLGDARARTLERGAETWIAQNGLFQFTLTSHY
jgi:TPR repeat protein